MDIVRLFSPLLVLLIAILTPGRAASAADKVDEPAGNELVNGGFEANEGWQVVLRNGALGDGERCTGSATAGCRTRSGASAFRLTRKNGLGFIELRGTQPVVLKANTHYTFRGYFHSENAPVSALLLFRLGGAADEDFYYDSIDQSAGYSSQSLIPNSPPGRWEKRVITWRRTADQTVYPHILLYGNPCTVWLDDLELTARPYKATYAVSEPYIFPFTPQQVNEVLQQRANATAKVVSGGGRTELLLDNRAIPPVLYKGLASTATTGDYGSFGKAGVPLSVVTVRLGPAAYYDTAIWTGDGQFNFAALDETLMSVLRKNPQASIIVDLWIYPYQAWGEANPEEVVRDHQGRKGYGTWANMEGFARDSTQISSNGANTAKAWWYPSYHSVKWRDDAGAAVAAVGRHLKDSPLGKCVAGFFITGGHDGQFINSHFVDASAPATAAFQAWCRSHYHTIEGIAAAWKQPLHSWENIAIPTADPFGDQEAKPPYLDPGPEADYREFREDATWQLRDYFAGVAKQSIGKPVIALCYGSPPSSAFLRANNLDGCGSMAYYPYRVPGYATGWKPLSSFNLHSKLFFEEIDLRSWVGDSHDEIYEQWVGRGDTPERWDAVARKLAGIALANDCGYWFYDMNQYYNHPSIRDSLARIQREAGGTWQRESTYSAGKWHPDVALVVTDQPQKYISAYFSSVGTSHSAGVDYQGMQLETSGVPFDKHYLDDILTHKELQNYKVYIFAHNVFLTQRQLQEINRLLKSGGRTLVWMYDTGYIGDGGKSSKAMSNLVGMRIKTTEGYERLTPIMDKSSHPLTYGVVPFLGMSELYLTMFGTRGAVSGYTARPQPFWVDDATATPLAHYQESGQVAAAIKRFPTWTSIYLAAPNSLSGSLLNNIATAAGAYVAGNGGQSINMNGRFLCLHGMRTGTFRLRLPRGTRRALDAMSGQTFACTDGACLIPVTAQNTYWIRFE